MITSWGDLRVKESDGFVALRLLRKLVYRDQVVFGHAELVRFGKICQYIRIYGASGRYAK